MDRIAFPKTSSRLQVPWLLWICSAGTLVLSGYLGLLLAHSGFMSTSLFLYMEALLFCAMASLAIFYRHKASWTLSLLGWFFSLSTMGVLLLGPVERGDIGPVMVLFPLLVLMFANVFLTLTYMRYPFIDMRTNLLGEAFRQDLVIDVQYRVGDAWLKGRTVTLSPTGLRFAKSLSGPALHVGESIELHLPEASDFRSAAYVLEDDGNSIRCEFTGLSLPSALQHLRLRRWLANRRGGSKDTSAKPPQSQAGYSLVSMMVVASIGTLVILAASHMLVEAYSMEARSRKDFAIEEMKYDLFRAINDASAWGLTVNDTANSSMECLRTKKPCDAKAVAGKPLRISNARGQVIFDSTVATTGFSRTGSACSGFQKDKKSNECPFRFEITWRPICTTNCLNPEVEVSAIFLNQGSEDTSGPMNEAKHSFVITRDSLADSLRETCEKSLNGSYDETTGSCLWTRLESTCDAQKQVLVGFDSAGTPICAPINAQSCPKGKWLNGFDSDGRIICVSG